MKSKLTIYTQPGCIYCDKLKDFFNTNDIEFEEIDIMKDRDALITIKNDGFRTVPQIYQNGKIFIEGGYNRAIYLGPEKILEMME